MWVREIASLADAEAYVNERIRRAYQDGMTPLDSARHAHSGIVNNVRALRAMVEEGTHPAVNTERADWLDDVATRLMEKITKGTEQADV